MLRQLVASIPCAPQRTRCLSSCVVLARGPLGSSASSGHSSSRVQRRNCAAEATGPPPRTRLGAYLEKCGAVWSEVVDVHEVEVDEGKRRFSWRVDLPPDRLAAVRHGEPFDSPSFPLPNGGLGRFQLFPRGDANCRAEGFVSLWLCSDTQMGPFKLRLGSLEKPAGSSEFARLEDALEDNRLDVTLELQDLEVSAQETRDRVEVEQSLQLTGLQSAEWTLYQPERLMQHGGATALLSSPPFRFHHVLLGDMYLEILAGAPHAKHCTIFFRCRVPTMKLKVGLAVGSAFSKSFVAKGRSTPDADIKAGDCLQVNLAAPGVLGDNGVLVVRCDLEEVVTIPATLRDMIPKLEERALWPKRL